MSYALQITQSLNWIVRQTVEVESNIVSVERVLEYARLPSEAPEVIHRNRPPISWPASGAVNFNNYCTRYREGLDLVLKNINLDIKAHEKIGVVGRTGAGKSSLTLALFRIIEPSEGNISIDTLNTSTIGLLDLRRRLAIIPQDAALFEGTIRDNLDPGHVHDDTELWSVLGEWISLLFHASIGTASWYLTYRLFKRRVTVESLLTNGLYRTRSTEGSRCQHDWWTRSENQRRVRISSILLFPLLDLYPTLVRLLYAQLDIGTYNIKSPCVPIS